MDSSGVYFVTRLKSNTSIEIAEQFLTSEKHDDIISDEDIVLTGFYTKNKYAKKKRIVKVYEPINDQYLVLISNQFTWTADTISQLYKARWDVEVFWRCLQSNLVSFFRIHLIVKIDLCK